MQTTVVRIERRPDRAALDLRTGHLAPRAVERGADRARVVLVAGGALLLGGDHVRVEIHVGEGCTLELEDVGGTVAYDADGRASSWTADIVVEAGARLLWAGLPFIAADGSDVTRESRIRLGAGAVACLRETLVLGRHGETGGRLTNRSRVVAEGRPLLVEELRIGGGEGTPGVLGEHRVLDAIALYGRRADDEPAESGAPGLPVLQLEGEGSLVRFLGAETHLSPLPETWRAWRAVAAGTGSPRPLPRRAGPLGIPAALPRPS
ncbi:urease accessory protein UreD [Microbacterium capsulatum]|uniref:Urease accessory protein UreD n=1 Tax=Microbacterium capsulatum TaxID=3041921 RepID=A0ABU0XHV2_9MICO|nr:urease accessory protein UreD [Microbacterium sp. ASV81]MDQ4214656.1 urease accessory protein UreD [Microbacterium sp. ASV81]